MRQLLWAASKNTSYVIGLKPYLCATPKAFAYVKPTSVVSPDCGRKCTIALAVVEPVVGCEGIAAVLVRYGRECP